MSAPAYSDDDVCATALAGLGYMRPQPLAELLAADRSPAEVWDRLVGDDPDLRPGWRATAPRVDLAEVRANLEACGARVLRLGQPDYPAALAADHEAPAVLFAVGHLELLDNRARVGIVGTRRCTFYGQDVARELGRDLGQLGITVVSGLAAGIDAAAHEGALAGSGCHEPRDDGDGPGPERPVPIAVVGSGVDVPYPRGNARLWARVAKAGLLLSESPPGGPPEAWRFPARNRIIAALSHALIVVESHAAGGSMHTVDAARARGIELLAVPGSIHSPSSEGTNRMLAEGAHPCTELDDILVALNRARPTSPAVRAPASKPRRGATEAELLAGLSDSTRAVAAALGWEASNLDQILLRTGLRPGQAGVALEELRQAGLAVESGGWWERTAPASARRRRRVGTVT